MCLLFVCHQQPGGRTECQSFPECGDSVKGAIWVENFRFQRKAYGEIWLMPGVKITGIGSSIPTRRITNQQWEKLVPTTDLWIQENIGIKERSRIEADRTTTDMGEESAKLALEMAGVKGEEIDFIICATNSQDHLYPSTASKIQTRLGAKKASSLDVQAGCTGWLFAMRLGTSLVQSGESKNVLVIGSDALSRALNFNDRSTVLFGDGSGSALLQADSNPDSSKKLTSPLFYTGTEPSLAMQQPTIYQEQFNALEDYLAGKDMDHLKRPLPSMDGKASLKLALTKSREAIDAIFTKAAEFGIKQSDLNAYIPHQTNVHVIKALCEHTGFPFEKIPFTLEKYGGISTAGLPTGLCEHLKNGFLKKGDLVLCTGYGAGFTYGAMLFYWTI